MSKIILIIGPTGIGKTKTSIELAKKYNAEIINTDRMAMYKETSIGTAKPTEKEMSGVVHHLINNISLYDDYTIYHFQNDSRNILNNLISKDKNVIIVGGSGLYIKAFLYNYELQDEEFKDNNLENLNNEELKELANSIESNNIHINNRNRLIRFINSYKNNKKIIKNSYKKDIPLYEFTIIGLTTNRDILYERLNNRVDKMFQNGLVKEAEKLYNGKKPNINRIIGYKELIPYFEDKISLEEAKENIKKDTRHYAKRQYTWYNHQINNIKWFNVDFNNFDKTLNEITSYIN